MSGAADPGHGWVIRRFDEVESTNALLLDEARAGAPAGLVAVADHQRAGRGRLGRSWWAAPGSSLLVSVLVRPGLGPSQLGLVTMAAGLALADAVYEAAGVVAALKWPNDLVVGERKLAGLLAESIVVEGRADAVVVGAGCNITPDAYPPELAGLATSCEIEAGRRVDREQLLVAYLDGLGARLAPHADVTGEYRRRLATLGRRVRVELPRDVVIGIAVDVDEAGALLVLGADGVVVTVSSGDVVHLRNDDG